MNIRHRARERSVSKAEKRSGVCQKIVGAGAKREPGTERSLWNRTGGLRPGAQWGGEERGRNYPLKTHFSVTQETHQ